MWTLAHVTRLLHDMLMNLGFEVATKKCTPPSKIFKYLGILVDTESLTLSIDDDKLARVKREVSLLD